MFDCFFINCLLCCFPQITWDAGFSAQDKSGRQVFLHLEMSADSLTRHEVEKNDSVSARKLPFAACFDFIQDDLKRVHGKNMHVQRFEGADDSR